MERINKIEINNFKSIRHQIVDDCKRVNIFIGYPNVGKSNILEAIGLFTTLELSNEQFRFNEICRVKQFYELFYNHDSKETNSVILNNKIQIELITNQSNDLEIRAHILIDHANSKDCDNIFSSTTSVQNQFTFVVTRPALFSNYKHIISPIRKYEYQKDVFINGTRPLSLSIPNGSNLLDVLQRNGSLRKEIVEIFREYGLKLIIDRGDQSIKFQKELDDGTGVNIPYHQVADTLRRLIFFKAAIQTNSNCILLFEEPEAHMFPPYISKIANDIIFDKNNNQYFVSTHSPFVLNDFMEELKDDELSIYTVSLKNGETVINRLTDTQVTEIYQYGIDLFFNLESFLKND